MTPTVTLWSDECEYGIRGYNEKCMAWRWRIPPEWIGILTFHLMDFLASATSIYTKIQKLVKASRILAHTDSLSALGHIHKASFEPVNEEFHNTVYRWAWLEPI